MVDRREAPAGLAECDESSWVERFTALFEHMQEAVVLHELVVDAAGAAVDYRIVDVNPQYERHTGLPRAAVVGRLASVAYGTDRAPYLEEFAAVALGGAPLQFEAFFPPLQRYFSISVARIGPKSFATIFSDATQVRTQAEVIEKSRMALRALLDNQPHLAWLKDRDGRFLAVNHAFAEACGQPSAEAVVGKTDCDVWPAALAEAYQVDDRAVMEAGQQKVVEEQIAEVDGTRWFETYKSPVFAPDGSIVGTTGVARDITERKRAEEERLRAVEERRKLEQQVMHAQKLESLGVLAGGIAHDFNNLLTSILGNADLAQSQLSPASPARSYLQDIERVSRRAADLCRQMLAYSGKGRFVVRPISLNEVVREMGHLLSVSISKKVIIKYDFLPALPGVMADATQMRQVVMNLITNASEAIGEAGGVVTLSTGVMDCDDQYLRGVVDDSTFHPAGQYAYVEVRDSGCGMDHETVRRIFDPFFSTKFTGRGLGLAAVLGIVRGHGGALRVYSEKGRGSTFKVLLPVCQQATPTPEADQDAGKPWHGQGLVLLADDEESIRDMGRHLLERLGFEVIVAADGREAVELFAQQRSRIRLVILDMTMPRLDGEACYRELRRIDAGVRVIMTSGYNEQEVISRFTGKGLAGFVQKPYRTSDLQPVIRRVLGEE